MHFILCIAFICFFVVSRSLAAQPLAEEHSADVIVYLWWALGILCSLAATVSGGVSVWIIQRVLSHDKEIAIIKARCELHGEEDDEE